MREIELTRVTEAVRKMYIEANHRLGGDLKEKLQQCSRNEESALAKKVFETIERNMEIAGDGVFPLCQDTGMACVFIEAGQDVHFVGGNLNDAINEGVRQACIQGYLRQTLVADPFRRINTGDSTPADINVEIVPGDKVRIILAAKGFGSENMSQLKMLPPSAGIEGAEEFIVSAVKSAGGNPCPPIIVGVGIGGNFSRVALMARKALLRPLDLAHEDPFYRDMEQRLLNRINALDIGPQGFGGNTTALSVNIMAAPTHIAGLPVAVNISCHLNRHREVIL